MYIYINKKKKKMSKTNTGYVERNTGPIIETYPPIDTLNPENSDLSAYMKTFLNNTPLQFNK